MANAAKPRTCDEEGRRAPVRPPRGPIR
jgi:hypothetical protein